MFGFFVLNCYIERFFCHFLASGRILDGYDIVSGEFGCFQVSFQPIISPFCVFVRLRISFQSLSSELLHALRSSFSFSALFLIVFSHFLS